MAYDWLAGNMYMVFEETRCIHACSITEAIQKCTEILVNNKMADNVGGLALHPDYRYRYGIVFFMALVKNPNSVTICGQLTNKLGALPQINTTHSCGS